MSGVQPYDIDSLKVDPKPLLDGCSERLPCETCGKKTKFFCYFCCKAVAPLEGKIPQIRLPFKMDILKHAKELDGKSTAVHAKIVAPEDIDIIIYADACLRNVDPTRTALLFPGPDAKDIADLDPLSFDRIVVIDGTWSQAKGMIHNNPRLQLMQKVTVKPRKTRFWRYQNLDESFMATIEAIYFLYRDSVGDSYNGEYDALMFFYKYFYDFIQSEYAANPEKPYHSKHQQGYIAYDKAVPSKNPRPRYQDTRAKVNYEFDELGLDAVFDQE
ncbi:hypothetical protein J3B02_004906 [Coemansia erecta]|uniref:tRNA-uridine aminocarboxypropyltransferase 1 n=1 Tax=Coemansia asiatica TaxID=1052880 RepID=A0A9W7XSM4_9FUNG|nr:hypothetical protein LPJ64_000120 [Coemansia asiatica]KAJ2844644.1 hypothetical protein J3B02_004906 [Coemansia erecta]KAJ2868054.1 hypothetical protein FB639_004895 [Coemansia asiatica]